MKQMIISLETTSDICSDDVPIGFMFHLPHSVHPFLKKLRGHLNYPSDNRDRKRIKISVSFSIVHRYASFSFSSTDYDKFEGHAPCDYCTLFTNSVQ